MKMRVAVFSHGVDTAWLVTWNQHEGDDDSYCPGGYVRVSDWVDVDFPERPRADVVPEQIAKLDERADEIRREMLAKLNEIACEKASLLALTHEAAA